MNKSLWKNIDIAKKFKVYSLNKENNFRISKSELQKYFKDINKIQFISSVVSIQNSPNLIARRINDGFDGDYFKCEVFDKKFKLIERLQYNVALLPAGNYNRATIKYVYKNDIYNILYIPYKLFWWTNTPIYRKLYTNTGVVFYDRKSYKDSPFEESYLIKVLPMDIMKDVTSIEMYATNYAVGGVDDGIEEFDGTFIDRYILKEYEQNTTCEIQVLFIGD